MCSPDLIRQVAATLGPSDRLSGGSGVPLPRQAGSRSFSRVIDLTHPLPTDFPSANGEIWLEIEDVMTFEVHGINFKRWKLHEHLGTHIDAPIHFSRDGWTSDAIPVVSLVLPLAVVDIRSRAASDPDAELSVEDIQVWEAEHGQLPPGCCVGMLSGWDSRATGAGYRNVDDQGRMHFPGVHPDAAQMLIEDRQVAGLGVDTLSLDHGISTEFPTHRRWLPSGRWGAEGLANLTDVPAAGATIIVGAPTVVGATGGPSRIIALA
ncbi:cyclase family protein [Rhodobacteraceae bacterium 2CG4]|uniref:Cyclase family protein n=2 Tax=Halovulum marinum TaxID=2662447 RepID=A0A6L5Z6C2_9RHOB|nr:cyclase family protein [Halovulum marinum]